MSQTLTEQTRGEQHEISPEEFLKALKGDFFIETDWFYLEKKEGAKTNSDGASDSQPREETIVIKNARFTQTDDEGIVLYDFPGNVVRRGFKFINSDVPALYLLKSTLGSLVFHATKVAALQILQSNTGKLSFLQNSDAQYVNISDSKSESLTISNSQSGDIRIIGGEVSLLALEKNGKAGNIEVSSNPGIIIDVHNSQCEKLEVSNSTCLDLRISVNSRCGDMSIYKSKVEEFVIFYKSVAGIIRINGSVIQQISIGEASVSKLNLWHTTTSLNVYNSTVPILEFVKCILLQVTWAAGSKGELYMEGCKVYHLNLLQTAILKETVISIVNSELSIVQLQELLIFGALILRNITSSKDIQFEKSRINEAKYEEIEKITGRKPQDAPLFRIANSSLGKMEITGCDLSDFDFEYKDSKLLEAFITGTRLPRDKIEILRNSNTPMPARQYYEQKVAIYNQLKRIFEQQGDTVEATWYHAKAMSNQEKILGIQYAERKSKFPKWWCEEAFDLLYFRLNKWSNNHGESWRRALVFSFVVLLTIYAAYFLSVNYRQTFSLNAVGNFIGYFFSFLDVTHRFDFMVEKEQLTGISRALDFMGRIATGYCIYQFVAAFRRHGRKTN